jgi:hypothetical protein
MLSTIAATGSGWPSCTIVGHGAVFSGELMALAPRVAERPGRAASATRGREAPRNWPALSRALEGNIVPDFPLCNKSFNQSYSGNDL